MMAEGVGEVKGLAVELGLAGDQREPRGRSRPPRGAGAAERGQFWGVGFVPRLDQCPRKWDPGTPRVPRPGVSAAAPSAALGQAAACWLCQAFSKSTGER